jgi:signal transduction histidine kinase
MLAGEIDSFQTEKRYLHKTGRVIDIVLSVSLVHDSDGQPLHFVAQILDITGLKRQQVKLEEALTRAEAANVAKQDFLATMSHELRTPLNAIIGFYRMIGDQMFGPLENTEYVDFANEINRSGQHLLGLIEAVLEFSNADAIELKLVRVPVEIGTVARSALEVVADRGHMGGIEFEWAIPSELPLALGDPARIRQILINLLTNAIKFTDRGGTVRLSATRPGDATIAITISDTGKGIAPEHLAHVFEPFYLADGTMNRKIQDGIGLGLPLARRLAELSGGSLTLESELGVGTTATVVLPSLEQ